MIAGTYTPVVWNGSVWSTRVKDNAGVRWDAGRILLRQPRALKQVLKVYSAQSAKATKWVCSECGCRCFAGDILLATNPFCAEEDIAGCPSCKDINTLRLACDHPGCWEPSSCGYPTDKGYRRTCHKHYQP